MVALLAGAIGLCADDPAKPFGVGVPEREPDQAGLDFWVGELDSGNRTQSKVFEDMVQSDEFVQLTVVTISDAPEWG